MNVHLGLHVVVVLVHRMLACIRLINYLRRLLLHPYHRNI